MIAQAQYKPKDKNKVPRDPEALPLHHPCSSYSIHFLLTQESKTPYKPGLVAASRSFIPLLGSQKWMDSIVHVRTKKTVSL